MTADEWGTKEWLERGIPNGYAHQSAGTVGPDPREIRVWAWDFTSIDGEK